MSKLLVVRATLPPEIQSGFVTVSLDQTKKISDFLDAVALKGSGLRVRNI